jgi:hypothetical protein
MRLRVGIGLATAILAALGSSPAQARAADRVVAHDTSIASIYPLGGDLVYARFAQKVHKRLWMARYHGHLRPARGIPNKRTVFAGDIGLDANGRKVFTFVVTHRNKLGTTVSTKWFVYDLARNRTRSLKGLPSGCLSYWVAVWRDSIAYTAGCKSPAKSGLFVKRGKHTRLYRSDPGGQQLVFRGGTLAVVFDDGLDDFFVEQFMANGDHCERRIDPSFGDATSETGWFPSDLWVANGSLVWTMGDPRARSDFAILAAKVQPGCDTPGPVGRFPFTPETTKVQAIGVDDGRVFYADGRTLRRHALPAQPSFAPPPNDDFEQAQQLSGDAPLSATGNVAYATVQPGEPLADTEHTVWYAFRPATSGTVYVTVDGACPYNPPGPACGGTYQFGVYTGSNRDALTQIPLSQGPGDGGRVYTRVDAVAGQTYWISVGSPAPVPKYEPFTVHVSSTAPA